MRKVLITIIAALLLTQCNNNKTPDTSNIKLDITTKRFEKDLFILDSTNFSVSLDKLIAQYPSFGENYISTILGADPKWSADTTSEYVKGFIETYKKVYDTSLIVFSDFKPYEKNIKQSLKLAKYYFPQYKVPQKIITYIGPIDGYGDIITDDALLIGLHQHLGNNFSLYKSEQFQQTYPKYISNSFTPDNITVNCMKNIVADMFPEKLEEKTLVQQMVEKGKRFYILSKLVPNTDDNKLLGYTPQQMKDCYKNENIIWDLFIKNNLLQSIDYNIIKNYIGESPKTQELGEASPGNIGSFVGFQIVKKYMDKHPGIDLQKLMQTENDIVFQEAKYKP